MTVALEFAYAQARIQARFAALPTEEEWQRLAAFRTLSSFLEESRAGPLRDWVKGFSSQSDVHDLEAGLRALYREILEAVAAWVPGIWREAVSSIRWLALLPLLTHLRAGGGIPDWVGRDPALRALFGDGGESEGDSRSDASLQRLIREGTVHAWTDEWRRTWPSCSRAASLDLESLAVLLVDHAETFRRVAPAVAWSRRKALRERLRLRLHRSTLQPAVPFIYLALTALDLERLRAALVDRALFAERDERVQAVAGRVPA